MIGWHLVDRDNLPLGAVVQAIASFGLPPVVQAVTVGHMPLARALLAVVWQTLDEFDAAVVPRAFQLIALLVLRGSLSLTHVASAIAMACDLPGAAHVRFAHRMRGRGSPSRSLVRVCWWPIVPHVLCAFIECACASIGGTAAP